MIHEVKDIIEKYEKLYESADKNIRDVMSKKFEETGRLSEMDIPAELDFMLAGTCAGYIGIGSNKLEEYQNMHNAALALIVFTKNMNGIFQ